MSNFLFNFVGAIRESTLRILINQGLLASLFDRNGNRNGHTDHGVVTGADKTHHLVALGVLKGLQSGEAF